MSKRHKRQQHHFDRHAISPTTTQEITRRLNAIYRDEDGEMPDMQHISIKKKNHFLRFILILLILGTAVSIGAWFNMFFLQKTTSSISYDEVAVTIEGPKTTAFSVTSTFTITYENRLTIPVKNSTVTLRYPEGFTVTDTSLPAKNATKNEFSIGTINAGEKKSFTISGNLLSPIHQARSLTATLAYQPEGITSAQQKTHTFEIETSETPYQISITGPAQALVGSETELIFEIRNTKTALNQNLELVPILPDNFSLTTSSPVLNSGNLWVVTPSTSTSKLFKLRGKYTSSSSDVVPIKGQLFFLPNSSQRQRFLIAETELSSAPAPTVTGLALSINGSTENKIASAQGETLVITAQIKNTTKKSLKDITTNLILQGPSVNKKSVMDWTNLEDKNNGKVIGEQLSQTVRQGSIMWNKTMIPKLAELKPGEEVTVEIRLPIKTAKDFDISTIKEKVITVILGTTAHNDSGKVETSTLPPISITLGSNISFENRHSLETRDGKEVHSINWVVHNIPSGIKNATISAEVFGTTRFEETSSPSAGKGSYNEVKKQITWIMDELPQEIDVVNWPFTLTLDTKNPTQTILLSKITLTAEDAETGNKITATGDAIPLNTN